MSTPSYILGLESSCDETACALVDREGRVRVNAVASQMDLHARYGGIVPEEASRRHIEAFLPLISSTLSEVGVGWDQIDSIAVTYGPGLIGCLLIGVETAKALAWRYDKPLRAVHHLHGHLHAPFLLPPRASGGAQPVHLLIEGGEFKVAPLAAEGLPEGTRIEKPAYPHLGLIISGGHTSLARVDAPGRCTTLATTRDDAVGEAYDKVARVLGLGFPGGPVIDRRANEGRPDAFVFKAPMKRKDEKDFSFSGLKSAIARKVEELRTQNALDEQAISDLCTAFQFTAIDVLLAKSFAAARLAGLRDLLIVGGVASNRGLRRAAASSEESRGLRLWFPHVSLCTDNAAMIAGLAWHIPPRSFDDALALNPEAVVPLDESF